MNYRHYLNELPVRDKECELTGNCYDNQKGGSSNVMRYVYIAVGIAIAYFLYKRFKK